MIPVPMPAEPPCFHEKVRQEGLRFLEGKGQSPQENPRRGMKWKKGELWGAVRDDLCKGYHNRCVYSCFILEKELQQDGTLRPTHSIDHFQPKSSSPAYLAYEWSNLRWAWKVIDNEGKQDHHIDQNHDPTRLTHDIVELKEDINGDWIVVPASSLDEGEQKKVHKTIQDLGLNKLTVKTRRKQYVEDFQDKNNQYDDLLMQERQPFIYRELRRLGFL